MPRLVLSSASPRRRELLEKLGVPFDLFEPAAVDEDAVSGSAAERCEALAIRKALWGWKHYPYRSDLTVIGSDTLVALRRDGGEEILGKPASPSEARRMLSALSGRTHRVVTGVAVARSEHDVTSAVEVSEVTFRNLDGREIEEYVASGDAEGKAGAYGIQSRGSALIAGFSGCYYNIVGLPLVRLRDLLRPDFVLSWRCDCGSRPLQRGMPGCGSRGA